MIKLTFAQRQQAEALIATCIDDPEAAATELIALRAQVAELRDVLDAFATQHACGCGHPACRDCQRDAMAIAALQAGPEATP